MKEDCLSKCEASSRYVEKVRNELLEPFSRATKEATTSLSKVSATIGLIMENYESYKEALDNLAAQHKKLLKRLDESLAVYNSSGEKSKVL